KVAVTRFGAATDVAARVALRRHHVDPERDVTILQLGGMPEILGALSTGAVQGGVLSPPSLFRARRLGLRELVDVTDLDITFPNPGIIVSQRRIQADPEQIRRFMRGFVEGIAAAKRQKEFTKAVIGRYTRTTDPDVLEETYQLFVVKLLRRLPSPDLPAVRSALEVVARQNPRARSARPEAFVDDRFVKELEQSGLLERLYP
ncbi:MAG: ABC transporter substrate-binding protein, partial [Deltaproteobacteria bacterium]|nr:ABC transporter substrate-binding protein [Deltaproteobacteria bacterium]